MRLFLLLLVLNWYLAISESLPTPQPQGEWKQSRFIIENRKHIYNQPLSIATVSDKVSMRQKFISEGIQKQGLLPVVPKDLTAEASFEKNVYENYNENSLGGRRWININEDLNGSSYDGKIRNYENRKNVSRKIYLPQTYFELYNGANTDSSEKNENEKVIKSDKISKDVIKEVSDNDQNYFASASAIPKGITPKNELIKEKVPESFRILVSPSAVLISDEYPSQDFRRLTTTPRNYNLKKSEDRNLIEKNIQPMEKHVYETRIERVSYHQEVLLNYPTMESVSRGHWPRTRGNEDENSYDGHDLYNDSNGSSTDQTEIKYIEGMGNLEKEKKFNLNKENNFGDEEQMSNEKERKYEEDENKSEKDEKKYEEDERKHEENEKKYEEDEKEYEEDEKKFEEDEKRYEEDEKKYEEDEKRYEEDEKKYEEDEKRYEEDEKKYEEDEKFEEDEKKYEKNEKKYEEDKKNYQEEEKIYEQDEKHSEENDNSSPEQPNEEIYPRKENNSEDGKSFSEGKKEIIESKKVLPITGDNVTGYTKSDLQRSNNKFGYVVEGDNYRKYRVEERTADGFIVGEYGVVSHDDGSLRGVRYTADGATNPQLIYEALIKFLSL